MTRTFHLLLLVFGISLTGCATHFSDHTTWLPAAPRQEPIQPAKDGKILVMVSGDARQRGPHWIPEDASILTVEQISGAGDEGGITLEPKFVVIYREANGRTLELRYDLKRRTALEKQNIHLQHGDCITFPWTNCW